MIDALYGFLSRIGFHDPLHALLVHMPIGLVIGALCFFLLAVIFGRSKLIPTARHASILAFVFVFPTILTGVFDWLHFYRGVMMQPITMKMILAGAVLVILGAGIILGSEVRFRTWAMMVVYALAFVAVVGLGYFGGKLVYGGAAAKASVAEGAAAVDTVGEQIFTDNCTACHPGGGNAAVPTKPIKGSRILADRERFVTFLRKPSGEMPASSAADISDERAGNLYQYLSAMQAVWK
jgi:uncharacterized membrane protein